MKVCLEIQNDGCEAPKRQLSLQLQYLASATRVLGSAEAAMFMSAQHLVWGSTSSRMEEGREMSRARVLLPRERESTSQGRKDS